MLFLLLCFHHFGSHHYYYQKKIYNHSGTLAALVYYCCSSFVQQKKKSRIKLKKKIFLIDKICEIADCVTDRPQIAIYNNGCYILFLFYFIFCNRQEFPQCCKILFFYKLLTVLFLINFCFFFITFKINFFFLLIFKLNNINFFLLVYNETFL